MPNQNIRKSGSMTYEKDNIVIKLSLSQEFKPGLTLENQRLQSIKLTNKIKALENHK